MSSGTRMAEKDTIGRDWVNRATLSGVVLVIGSVAIFRNEQASANDIAAIFGVVLLGVGLLRLVFQRSGRLLSFRTLPPSLLLVAGGLVLLAAEVGSISVLGRLVGAIMATYGIYLLIRAFRVWRSPGDQAEPEAPGTADLTDPEDAALLARVRRPSLVLLVEASLWLVAALVLALVPETLLALLILVVSFVALGSGLILIAFGVRPETRQEAARMDTMALPGVVRRWALGRDIGVDRRDEVAASLFFEGPDAGERRGSFAVLMVLSSLIATFGVIQDSTAVVIGAMLVAPLMTPILGVAAGIIGAWPRRTVNSLVTVGAGALLAVAVAVLASSWIPSSLELESNSQITSRVTPTLLDLAIAVAAGAAGAYALVDKRVSSSMSGVAIAVALVPPLAVVGVTIHLGDWDRAFGAGLLFATNAVAIILTGSLVFLLSGFSSAERLRHYRDALRTSLSSVLLVGLAIVIPLSLAGQALVSATILTSRVETAINDWLPDEPGWSLLSWHLDEDQLTLTVVGPAEIPPVIALDSSVQQATSADIDVILNFIQSETYTTGPQPPG